MFAERSLVMTKSRKPLGKNCSKKGETRVFSK